MARGGGGGGHSGSSFGGSRSGRSFSGGGGRSSSFGGGRSSSFGGGYSSGPSHHSSYYGGSRSSYYGRPTPPPPPPGPGYYDRPPRRVYHGSRSSSPCSCIFALIIVAFILLGGVFTAIGGSIGSSSDITKSSEKREKMDTSNTTYSNTWFVDELGWLGRGSKLIAGLEDFYNRTGVQPLVYLAEYKEDYKFDDSKSMLDRTETLYEEIFGSDEGHLLFVYYACKDDRPSLMNGQVELICGKQTNIVMDENAQDILESCYWHYYNGDASVSVDEMLGNTFTKAGKEIMRGPIRIRYVVIIVVSVLGVIVVISLLFKWWKAKKAQKNKEAEDLEKILSKPLETFGKSDVDDLKDKYKD